MPEETENTETAEQETANSEESEVQEEQQTETEQEQEEPKFNKTQLQQLSSITGNLIKKVVDEQIMPVIEQNKPKDVNLKTADNENPAKKMFNEQLFEQIMQGDVLGAFEKYTDTMKKADQSLSQAQQQELTKQLHSYSEKPHYKDVYPEMEKMAKDLINEGWPAKAAAETSYFKSVALHQGGNDFRGSLGMTTGSRRTPTKKAPKLPPQFKEAFERDKDKGLFKTEQEFIDKLAPQIRKQYGL
jgi:hypothetical protein